MKLKHIERQDHMDVLYNDPNQYLVCRNCKVNKDISNYRFKHYTFRLCLYLNRYRLGHNKERFSEHVKRCNVEVQT